MEFQRNICYSPRSDEVFEAPRDQQDLDLMRFLRRVKQLRPRSDEVFEDVNLTDS